MKMSDSNTILIPEVLKSNALSHNPKDKSNAPSIDPADYTLGNTIVAAKLLGVSYNTLWRWRRLGNGPCFIKVGKQRARYRLVDIQEWLETHTRSITK